MATFRFLAVTTVGILTFHLAVHPIRQIIVRRVCIFIFFTGNYTETLSDAKTSIGLQPSFLKAFVRGTNLVIYVRLSLYIATVKENLESFKFGP